ncbi:OprD family outer membrane porin [Pseudomonas sp. RGM2987]|uniref:OprD family outer membrane porin n=1 Tax=Pseudomonas sp. RGM2987 TaxID=2930090 RepID=UPI001FD65265|nr:OprD family outer membrane porin [Pseudomonas sp. RGM2987]MCJ8207971.1 OprD family porin [Pseudomonas sp. RGM2987]
MVVTPACADFLEDSKVTLNARTLYFEGDNRDGGSDQRQTVQGFKLDAISGYTSGPVGFGIDAQALTGITLGGGIDNHSSSTVNTVSPVSTDGTPVHNWTRFGASLKAKISQTEMRAGSNLAPNVPVIVTNDGRLLPQTFEGAMFSSKDIENVTVNAGRITRGTSRASSNSAGLAANGGTKGSDSFIYGGADWKAAKDLTLQYYYAKLEDYYKQNFLGAIYLKPLGDDQSFKVDLRYFDSTSDGKNGDSAYRFNNNNGYARKPGEVDNKTWSAMFTYALGGHSFMLGRQRINDDGGFVWVNNGSIRDGRGRPEGEGGSSFYLFTDLMIGQFSRAGEDTSFGQYSYDFSKQGIPGLKAAISYISGRDIKDANGSGSEYKEWERDYRFDYTVPTGTLKGLGFTLRRANLRTNIPGSQGGADTDQTRFYINYSYAFM